jgi:AraC-like DNA-binding protein
MTRELNQPNQIFASFDEDPGFQWTVDHIQVLNDLMSCVREGDMNGMNQLISLNTLKLDLKEDHELRLAEDELRHVKNLVIILVQMLSIAARSGGLPEMMSLRLKEQYIRRLENLSDVRDVTEFADTVKTDFCRYVHDLRSPRVYSMRIQKIIDHIDQCCTRKITLQELADLAGVSKEHLTRIFRTELGMTPGEYIRRRRVGIAMQMLEQTDLSISRISEFLAFSSQPYFQKVFKEETGVTPLAFRKHPDQKNIV